MQLIPCGGDLLDNPLNIKLLNKRQTYKLDPGVKFNLALLLKGYRLAFQIDEDIVKYDENKPNTAWKSIRKQKHAVNEAVQRVYGTTEFIEFIPLHFKRTNRNKIRSFRCLVYCNRGRMTNLSYLLNDIQQLRVIASKQKFDILSEDEELRMSDLIGTLLELKCTHEDYIQYKQGKPSFRVTFEIVTKKYDEGVFMAQMCTKSEKLMELMNEIQMYVSVAQELDMQILRMCQRIMFS